MKTLVLAGVAALALLAGCATPPSGQLQDVVEVKATILSIDHAKRLVVLQNEKGEQVIAEVSEAVEGLDQVKAGDIVVASYSATVTWKVRPKDQKAGEFPADPVASPVKPGDKPTGSLAASVAFMGTISAIDLAKGTVTLTWPDGTSNTIKARDPANLKKVQVGDVVDILYSEALAVALRPAAK